MSKIFLIFAIRNKNKTTMENTTNKKHFFIDRKVRAIKDSNKASYLINIDDICRKMKWDNTTREYLLSQPQNEDGWMDYDAIHNILDTYDKDKYYEYNEWAYSKIVNRRGMIGWTIDIIRVFPLLLILLAIGIGFVLWILIEIGMVIAGATTIFGIIKGAIALII